MPIRRLWHGWTTPENADAYQNVLLHHVIPGIVAKKIPGYRGIEVLRRAAEDNANEVEFVTLMTFDNLQNVIDFQGEDYTRSYVPDAARAVLKRWDEHAVHYEVVNDEVVDDEVVDGAAAEP